MQMLPPLIAAGSFIVIGVLLAVFRFDMLIAGHNRNVIKDDGLRKDKYNIKPFCRALGICFIAIGFIMTIVIMVGYFNAK